MRKKRMNNNCEAERRWRSLIGAGNDKLSVSDRWPGEKGGVVPKEIDISGNCTGRQNCANTIAEIGPGLTLRTRTSLNA
jgi:hypothetical protein